MVSEEKRGAFSQALRRWRGQRGMSQIELALAAETTQRYVSFIESGRSLPGRGMVIRLGEALDLPLRERNALLLAAGYAPVYREQASTIRSWGLSGARSSASSRGIFPTLRWSSTGTVTWWQATKPSGA